VLKIHKDYKKV